ncbi:hypothetical protein K439DRAFT_1361515, partial [Ramaria rubella]
QTEPEPEPQTQGRGHRIRRLTAYIRDITEGRGSSTGLSRGSALPRGVQPPTPTSNPTSSTEDRPTVMVALTKMELDGELDEEKIWQSNEWPGTFETAMATATADILGDDPKDVEDVLQCPDGLL